MNPSSPTADALSYYFNRLLEALPIKLAVALALAIFSQLDVAWASIPVLYQYTIGWTLLDLLTGITKARITGTNDSKAGKEGAAKIVVYLSMLALADYAARSWGVAVGAIPVPIVGDILSAITQNLPYIAFALIGHTEATSNLENLRDIAKHSGKSYVALDALIAIMAMSKRKLEDQLKSMTGPLNSQEVDNGQGDQQPGLPTPNLQSEAPEAPERRES